MTSPKGRCMSAGSPRHLSQRSRRCWLLPPLGGRLGAALQTHGPAGQPGIRGHAGHGSWTLQLAP